VSSPPATSVGAVRVVICDYNALLASVTGLLRMSGYYVFQAHDGQAAVELCTILPDVSLLVLNTEGTGVDTPAMVRRIRERKPDLAVLHIGMAPLAGMPDDVVSIDEGFSAAKLLATVAGILGR
jgi:response regulator RpfG family c-di-GMP phosphodiesterase